MGGVIADPQISRRALVEFVDDLAQLAAVQLFALPSLKRFCNGKECAPEFLFVGARLGAGGTDWISLARLPRQDSLKRQFVFPAVAEVVLVSSDDTRPGKVRGDWDFPAGQDQFIALQGVVIRDADLRNLARLRLRHPEKMQVIVEPTHRVLEGDMKVPEAIGLGDLDASPDGWSHVQEAEPELVHVSLLSHW